MREETFGGLTVRIVGGDDGRGGGDGPAVVLLHGFGAPGDDLVPLGHFLGLPKQTRFVFPEAPDVLPSMFGDLRAWWMIDLERFDRQMSTGERPDLSGDVPDGLAAARDLVIAMVDQVEGVLGVPTGRLALGGFSQGSMLACDVALHTSRPLAGVALLSSTLIAADDWGPLMPARAGLPVLQSHGHDDALLPFEMAEVLRDRLREAGIDVEWHEFAGGHEIPRDLLSATGDFLRRVLGLQS